MLTLRFSTRAGRADIACDDDRSNDLRRLRLRFPSAEHVSNVAFEVEIDDLLLNIFELSEWPDDDNDIRWQQELATLVASNHSDFERVAQTLAGIVPDPPESTHNLNSHTDKLTGFQILNGNRLLELSHGADFSVPGAGKTRTALAVFGERRNAGEVSRLLVIAPKSAFESWQEECATWFGDEFIVAQYAGAVPPVCDLLLVNYERLPEAREGLLRWLINEPVMLVLDEAHRTKRGVSGVWGSVCMALAPFAKRRLILTGTPAPNGARDLESLFGFVWPGQGRLAVSRAIAGGDLARASRELKPLYVRTTKHQLHLPAYRPVVRRLKLPPLHAQLYDALAGSALSFAGPGADRFQQMGRVVLYLMMAATTPALLAVGAHRHEALPYRIPPLPIPLGSDLETLMRDLPSYEMSPKYREVAAIVAANASAGRKTLVWSTFVRNLTTLHSLLGSYEPAIVHGGTPDRAEQLARFRNDDSCMVLLSNPATLGEGISLHHVCNDAVYLDRDFAAGKYLQSLDRIHRLGLPADASVNVTVLVSDGTIDDVIEQRLTQKLEFLGRILDDPAVRELGDLDEETDVSTGMNDDDLTLLLRHVNGHRPG